MCYVCVCSQTSDQDSECGLHSVIDLKVSEQPQNVRNVVNLVIALHRMMKTQKVQSTEFTDDELCNIFLENLVEGNLNFCTSKPFHH